MATLERALPARFRPQLALLRSGNGSCEPVVAGDSADADGDGLQNDLTCTFSAANCFYQDSLGNGFAVSGSVSIQETDTPTTLVGFAIDFSRPKVLLYTDSASAGLLAAINGHSTIGFTADYSARGTPPPLNTFDNTGA